MMNDLISRQAAIDAHYEYCNKHPDAGFPVWSLKILENLPSAQPEIIRCKDCKHSEQWYRDRRRCFLWSDNGVSVFDDGFCNYAERRTDEQAD